MEVVRVRVRWWGLTAVDDWWGMHVLECLSFSWVRIDAGEWESRAVCNGQSILYLNMTF